MIECNKKKVLEWTPEISVNNIIIDEQHKTLLKQIGILAFALRTGEAEEKVKEILDFLDQYISEHLKYEEEYMLKNQYPKFLEHKVIHDDFRKKYHEFKISFLLGNNLGVDRHAVAEEVENYIYSWWLNHISCADQEYANFIKNKK